MSKSWVMCVGLLAIMVGSNLLWTRYILRQEVARINNAPKSPTQSCIVLFDEEAHVAQVEQPKGYNECRHERLSSPLKRGWYGLATPVSKRPPSHIQR